VGSCAAVTPGLAREAIVNLELILDEQMPRHALYVTYEAYECHVRVSRCLESQVLKALNPSIAVAIAKALDTIDQEGQGPVNR
jgi:hypothetical protein